MANFNTYQTRHFYVAKAIDANVDTNGDIALKTTATGEAYFVYRNADGLLTRSDLIKPENIVSLKLTNAADMATPLMAHTISLATGLVLSDLVGKDITLTVNVHQFVSFDASDYIPVVATITGNTTNTASAAAFNKAIAKALINAVPKMAEAPFKVFIGSTEITKTLADSGYPNAGSLVIVEAAQKYRRGLMSNDPYQLSVSSAVRGSNTDEQFWAADTVAPSTISGNTVIPGVYKLADLEDFALGERGDIYRGSVWPNNIERTYMIDLTKNYNVLSVEFFWQGSAENVQKSPRMIQVAAEAAQSNDVATALYNSLKALTPAGKFDDLDSRVETLEG